MYTELNLVTFNCKKMKIMMVKH